MKKLLALFLSCTMVMTLGALSAYAEESAPADNTAVEEETQALPESVTELTDTDEEVYDISEFGDYLADTLTYKEAKYYLINPNLVINAQLAFADEECEIPYIPMSDAIDLMNQIIDIFNSSGGSYPYPGYEITMLEDDTVLVLTKDNGAFMVIDLAENYITISDVEGIGFLENNPGEMVSLAGFSTEDNVFYLISDAGKTDLKRSGYVFGANLGEYNLKVYYQDGEVFVPLELINDIFTGYGFSFLYNGENVFVIQGSFDTVTTDEDGNTMVDYYYANEPKERSKSLAKFTYSTLCFMMDLQYGLKSTHGINDFNTYIQSIGLFDKLTSTDAEVFDSALAELVITYLNDVHSAYLYNSPYAGISYEEALYWDETHECGRLTLLSNMDKIKQMRIDAGLMLQNEAGGYYLANAYEEVGDTAYITFDSFTTPADPYSYYDMKKEDGSIDMEALEEVYMYDTMGLVIYANQMINREDSPVKNVVIDISNNGGGACDAATYISAWVLGTAQINCQNQASGAAYTYNYNADVDLDGVITENDRLDLDRFDVYCLESAVSFSCGNLVPALFKASGKVTLIGQKSSGGSCAVYMTSAADGTGFRISSVYDLCVIKNGSYYSIDQGVEPDIYIKHLEKLYDREWLTEYIDSIY